ncbi:MAG: hypothetical protein ACYCYM_04105 [Saccharofermentanales bacterium]
MICEKCGGRLAIDKKCTACWHDNSNVDFSSTVNDGMKTTTFRSVRLTVFLYLVIALDALMLIYTLFKLFTIDHKAGAIILLIIAAGTAISEIVLSYFMLQLKKKALIAYLILSIFGGVLQLFTLKIVPVILRALLLYFIFSKDWQDFE